MKPHSLLLLLLITWMAAPAAAADAPAGIAGIELGKDIADCALVNMPTALPVRHLETYVEVETKPIEGFKSGLVGYGTCAAPGKILRIKLKYADSTPEFFDNLFKRYTARFGKPDQWRGDPFHAVKAWKWSFSDTAGNRISLILQHNTVDSQEKMGTSVKMTLTGLFEEEIRCMEARETRQEAEARPMGTGKGQAVNWDLLLPR